MKLLTAGLTVNSTAVTSDKILTCSVKPLTNALDVIRQLEPVESEQTYDLVDQYNEDTPQFHQCGLIAQQVQQIEALKHAVFGGEVGEDGNETIRALNYNIVTYSVKAIQELHQVVQQQQMQIDAQKQQIDRMIDIILHA